MWSGSRGEREVEAVGREWKGRDERVYLECMYLTSRPRRAKLGIEGMIGLVVGR